MSWRVWFMITVHAAEGSNGKTIVCYDTKTKPKDLFTRKEHDTPKFKRNWVEAVRKIPSRKRDPVWLNEPVDEDEDDEDEGRSCSPSASSEAEEREEKPAGVFNKERDGQFVANALAMAKLVMGGVPARDVEIFMFERDPRLRYIARVTPNIFVATG
ncbi:hypothetical protein B0H14DRAFT_3712508 [Mycena olivaceomarginata]|nr:hypothetical protein B0H14DRAFT_3712508 [Mycena olivaceomarginata]